MPALPFSDALTDLSRLEVHAAQAETVTWQGRRALHLVNGLVLLPFEPSGDFRASVRVGAEDAAYPGIAFHTQDPANHELLYAQPHTSGLWDALQYDSVLGGSATWQIYHGPAYQRTATVPTGSWFTLQARIAGGAAELAVDGQPPLRVARLVQGRRLGRIGVWTYLPAYFAEFTLEPAGPAEVTPEASLPTCPDGTLRRWHLAGVGLVEVETNGIVNVNRYLPWHAEAEAELSTTFRLTRGTDVELQLGYSDRLILALDGEPIHSGHNTFRSTGRYEDRGYILPGAETVRRFLSAGRHTLSAHLRTVEPFGWGLTVAVSGEGVQEVGPEAG